LSINPHKIPGKKRLYVFDTIKKMMRIFIAEKDKQLGFHRTAITNADMDKSFCFILDNFSDIAQDIIQDKAYRKDNILPPESQVKPHKLTARLNANVLLPAVE